MKVKLLKLKQHSTSKSKERHLNSHNARHFGNLQVQTLAVESIADEFVDLRVKVHLVLGQDPVQRLPHHGIRHAQTLRIVRALGAARRVGHEGAGSGHHENRLAQEVPQRFAHTLVPGGVRGDFVRSQSSTEV